MSLTGKNVSIKLDESGEIKESTFKKIFSGSGCKNEMLFADTVNKNAVEARMFIYTANASKLTEPIKTRVETDPLYSVNKSVKNLFEKFFANKVKAVTFHQKGSFGMDIPMAIRFDSKEFEGNTLYFYSYDVPSNSYRYLFSINNSADKFGYLHFTTSLGNTLVIADKPLKLK